MKRDLKWKRYWNKPVVVALFLISISLIVLGAIPGIPVSSTLSIFFLFVGIGFLICWLLLLDAYFLGGPLTMILAVIGSMAGPGGGFDAPIFTPVCLYTRLDIDPDIMKDLRSYLLDRFREPRKNRETDRWISLKFDDNHWYKYDKRNRVLWIYRRKSSRDMLNTEYHGMFEDLIREKWIS